MKTAPILTALLCLTFLLRAQFEKNYTPLTAKGSLPQDFVTLSSEKYEAEKAQLSKSEKGYSRKTKEKFLLQTNFGLDAMLLSGKVLYNDEASSYVNKVADKALESEPQLRSQLRFYVLKSTAVNAFATNQGVILVTMGLLAQIENEAQLAFVICHEAVHFKEKHAIEKFLESDKATRGEGAYKQMTFDEKALYKCAFSKEIEKEADSKGIQIFLQSQYSTANVMGLYDVLKYAYLPFDDITFDYELFENSTLKLPESYRLKQTKEVTTADIDDDDERSTHPNISTRRKLTLEAIAGANNSGKSDCLTNLQEFEKIRDVARFELCRLYTLKHKYEMGIYTAYMLQKRFPDNVYLKKNIAYCIAGLAEYAAKGSLSDVHGNYSSIEGKSQALVYLIQKLDSVSSDINIVSVAYLAKLKKQYPEDVEIDDLFKHQINLLVNYNNLEYSSFSKYAPTPVTQLDSIIAITPKDSTKADELKKSKYEKLRELEADVKPTGIVTGGRFTKYAFVAYMNEQWFKQAFEDATALGKKEKKKTNLSDDYQKRRLYYKNVSALGINKIVVVDPYYARINSLSKTDKYQYLKSETGQVDFAERLKDNAKIANLDMEVLNSKNMKASETDRMNDLALMDEYIIDRLEQGDNVEFPFAERGRIRALADKYGTNYFMWTGTISFTDKNRGAPGLTALSVLMPFLMPFTLPKIIHGGQYTLFFAMVYNVQTDKLEFATFREIQNRTKDYILDSHIYDALSQLKSNKKTGK